MCLALWGALALGAAVSAAPPSVLEEAGRSIGRYESSSLSDRSGYRFGSKEQAQFHTEFERRGWRNFKIAIVPIGYEVIGKHVTDQGSQFATLYGNVDADEAPEWVVGCIVEDLIVPGKNGKGTEMIELAPDDRARLAVFKRDAEGIWRLSWASSGLGSSFATSKNNMADVEKELDVVEHLSLPISLVDIDGDRRKEIAYYCRSETPDPGGLPGIYRFDGSRMLNVAPQSDRFSVYDVDRDGRLEVVTASPYVGFGMGDDDVPRVWQWSGRQFTEASIRFPQFYRELKSRYSAYVQRMEASGQTFPKTLWERAIEKAASLAG